MCGIMMETCVMDLAHVFEVLFPVVTDHCIDQSTAQVAC